MNGYLHQPEATAASFTPDGWFVTGDAATIDADGYHRIVGRESTDVIKTGGYRVGAGEVEDALLTHPAVREAAVVGVPDDDLGQIIVAWVVADGVDEAALVRLGRRAALGPQAAPAGDLRRHAAPQRHGQGPEEAPRAPWLSRLGAMPPRSETMVGTPGSVPEWPKGADCKSAGKAYGGSNPSRPTGAKAQVRGGKPLLARAFVVAGGSW